MAVNIGPKIGIEGEKQYRKQVNELISQQKTFSAQMRELESSFDDSTSAMEKNRKKADLLKDAIKNQEKQVEELEKGLKACTDKYGESATQTQKWKQQVSNAKTELNKMKKALDDIPKPLEQFGKSMQETGKKISSFGDGFTKKVSTPIAALGGLSIAAFNEVDAGLDIVTVKTGATGQALEGLQTSVKNLATQIPTDFETAGEAIGEVNTRFGLTGQELETLSGKFIKFAELNDTDVSSSVDNVQKVLSAFGMETSEAGNLLDALNVVGQNTGISMDALETSMIKNAAALSDMGMDAYDAAEFLGQVETSGANVETVMSGMQKALVNAAEDGKTLPQALGEFQTVMNSTATDQEKLNAAIDLFGKKAGPAIYEACEQGSLSFEGLATDASTYLGSVETTFENTLDAPDNFKIALNKAKTAGSELGKTLLDVAAPGIEKIGDAAKTAGDWFDGLTDDQKEMVSYVVGALAIGGPAVSAVGNLTTAAGKVIEEFGKIPGAVETVAGAITNLASPAGITMLAIGGLTAAMIYSREQGIKQNEALQTMLSNTAKATEDLKTATSEMAQAINETRDNISDINAKSDVAGDLVDELFDLEAQSSKTVEQQNRMKTIVAELTSMYPDLSVEIDETTGSLSTGKAEVKGYVEEAKKLALIEAYGKASQDILQKMATASVELKKAQSEQAEGQKYLNEQQEAYNEMLATAQKDYKGNPIITKEMQDQANAVYLAKENMKELNAAVAEGERVVSETEAEYQLYIDSAEELSSTLTQTATAVKNGTNTAVTAAEKKTGEFVSATKKAGNEVRGNFELGFSTLPYTAAQATTTATNNTQTAINGMKLAPTVQKIEVPGTVTGAAKTTITSSVSDIHGKVTAVTGAASAAKTAASEASEGLTVSAKMEITNADSAASAAAASIRNWFANNPITTFVKAITGHAEGGFTNREQLSWLSEGNKPEVVIPLSQEQRANALPLYEKAGEILGVEKAVAPTTTTGIPSGVNASGSNQGMDFDQMYLTLESAAKRGMENANIRIYWNGREAGRIMKDMGVQFA